MSSSQCDQPRSRFARLSAGGNRIRTIGTALRKGSLGSAERRCRTDRLDGIIKPRSSRETSVVARGSLLNRRLVDGGTDGSNPSPSSGESGANLSLAGIRLSRSRSRGFPRLCGPGRAAWVGRDTRAREYLAERRWYLCRALFQYRTAGDEVGDDAADLIADAQPGVMSASSRCRAGRSVVAPENPSSLQPSDRHTQPSCPWLVASRCACSE